jgi:hypothetical protein
MARLSDAPNLRVKLSGICMPGRRWTPELNGPVVREAVALFGVARCMVASNFPVDGLHATFDEIMDGLKAITAGLPRRPPPPVPTARPRRPTAPGVIARLAEFEHCLRLTLRGAGAGAGGDALAPAPVRQGSSR